MSAIRSITSLHDGGADIEQTIEQSQLAKKYPFAYSTSDKDPMLSRVRSTVRSKKEFEPIDKLQFEEAVNIDHNVPLEEALEMASNPYKGNRRLRKFTKGSFGDSEGVRDMQENNDGKLQQQQRKVFERLVPRLIEAKKREDAMFMKTLGEKRDSLKKLADLSPLKK